MSSRPKLIAAAGIVAMSAAVAGPAAGAVCEVGAWAAPGAVRPIDHSAIISVAATAPVVLLGETHDNVDHHRWQLGVLAGLIGQREDLVLGLEAFPRRVQPVLDRWVEGDLTEGAFLNEVDWWQNWGFNPDLYLPILHFARLHRVPLVALNVDRSLVARVGDEGWEAIPRSERSGIGDPAAPSDAYVENLAASFAAHLQMRAGDASQTTASLADVRQQAGFARFVQAQLTWDRAMAEAIAEARSRPASPLVVGIIGSGHLQDRHGVPAQLADLGIEDAMVLLPADGTAACERLDDETADAVFVLDDGREVAAQKPRLGVMLAANGSSLQVADVVGGSVAAAAGLQPGDVIVAAAGRPIATIADLQAAIGSAGGVLPIEIVRGDRTLTVMAEFAADADQASS